MFDFHPFNVAELFDMKERGVVVIADLTGDSWPTELALKIGDPVEFRERANVLFTTTVTGIDMSSASPNRQFAFLISRESYKHPIPIGAEIWVGPQSRRKAQP